jgi:branched-chain amino acid transport system permease protein
VSVAVHFAMVGLGLVMFGAEGSRTNGFTDASLALGGMTVSVQSIVVVATALVLIGALYVYFGRTIAGKALRATSVNRLGARLVGIGTTEAGRLAFTLAAGLGVLSGILIGPLTTVYYDSGFLIGLKGFVGAIIGGLVSYPLAAAGALLVGVLESYSSFWASAFKEVIVFTLIIPVLLCALRDAACGRGRGDAMTTMVRNKAFWVFLVVLFALPVLPGALQVPEYWITLLNYIGLYASSRSASCC